MKQNLLTILLILVLSSTKAFGQISISNLKQAVTANSSAVQTLFNGYSKEHIDTKSGTIFYGNQKNSNTIAIERKQGSNIVFYGFDNRITFKQFEKEIDKISLESGCDVLKNIDTDMDTPLEVKFECGGYFYYLKTLNYNNVVAGYEFKIAKIINKKYIVDENAEIVAYSKGFDDENLQNNTQNYNAEKEKSNTYSHVALKSEAEFPGGMSALRKYISQNLAFPPDPDGVVRKMNIRFTINADGLAQDIRFDGFRNADIEDLIINLLKKMPKWKPAQLEDGTKTTFSETMPISF